MFNGQSERITESLRNSGVRTSFDERCDNGGELRILRETGKF
jgi:hypothetical protein